MLNEIIQELEAMDLFPVRSADKDRVEVLLVDFRYDGNIENQENVNQGRNFDPNFIADDNNNYGAVITPGVYTKSIGLGEYEFNYKNSDRHFIKGQLVDAIKSLFINKATELAESNMNSMPDQIRNRFENLFSAVNDEFEDKTLEEKHKILSRRIVAKLNNASNLIATDARIGPAQYILTDDNLHPVINESLDMMRHLKKVPTCLNEGRVILGRKNSIDLPGLIYLYNPDSFEIDEENCVVKFKMGFYDIGFFPEKNFMMLKFNVNEFLNYKYDDDSEFESDYE